MITYKELRWSDAFSYGKNNVLRLDANPLTQIVGKNGHGKSSLGLILEEVQFNKNSKDMKKASILNRYSKSKNYFIELDFDKDGSNYTISTSRTNSSGTVKLNCGGVDISSHTATATYKQIEAILGYDFIKFGQLVYQSSAAALEFLTATDTARKAFLIELLDLSKYPKASDVFKKLAADISKAVSVEEAKVETVSAWLKKYANEDLTLKVLTQEPEYPSELETELAGLNASLTNIVSTNKKISTNNTYKAILEGINIVKVSEPKLSEETATELKVDIASIKKDITHYQAHIRAGTGSSTCPTCKQAVDNSFAVTRVKDAEVKVDQLFGKQKGLEARLKEHEVSNLVYQAAQKQLAEWEKYHALYDSSMSSDLLNKEEIEAKVIDLNKTIGSIKSSISVIQALNKKVAEHNSKVAVISEQMQSMRTELVAHNLNLTRLSVDSTNYQVLVKAFSSTGLVAYKIECLVKDLEVITNTYLSELADGRFQLSFRIASADKLNVVITDNGQDVEITALSTGERARVNVATLLGIRSLMQALSDSRTNLLILDETIENLDVEGKEKLIEVLLKEENLNTFLISHGFSHPLLEKISVIKEYNISRIE
jgi:DNA repair exonuclease SbcCD ATPase subunit